MNVFVTLFVDLIRESFNQRALQFLLLLGALCLLSVLGMEFVEADHQTVLHRQAEEFNLLHMAGPMGTGLGGFTSKLALDFEILETRLARPEDGLPPRLHDAPVVRLRFEDRSNLDVAITNSRSFFIRKRTGKWPEIDTRASAPRYDWEDRKGYLVERMEEYGYRDVDVLLESQDPIVARIAVKADTREEIAGAHRIRLFFGAFDFPLEVSMAQTLRAIQKGVADTLVGLFGMLILVTMCASFIPEMLRKGTIDLVLARPISRVSLLLHRFLAGVLFAFLVTLLLIGASWIALSVRTATWDPWFLGCALTTTVTFCVLYSTGLLAGVVTRSATVSSIVPIAVWGASSAVASLYRHRDQVLPDVPGITASIEAAHAILPKIAELSRLNAYFLARSPLAAAAVEAPALPDVNWWMTAISTGLFAAVPVALAIWLFARKDW